MWETTHYHDQTLTPAELAAHLQHVPADKTIRLLSCNGSQSAQEIAQILGRDIVGSTGEMKIFDNGLKHTGNNGRFTFGTIGNASLNSPAPIAAVILWLPKDKDRSG